MQLHHSSTTKQAESLSTLWHSKFLIKANIHKVGAFWSGNLFSLIITQLCITIRHMHLDLSINKVPMSIHQPGNHKPETFTVKICIQNATAKQHSSTFLLLALKSYIYCPKVLQLFPGNTTGSRMTYSNLRNQRHSIGDSNLIRYLTSNSHMSIHHP